MQLNANDTTYMVVSDQFLLQQFTTLFEKITQLTSEVKELKSNQSKDNLLSEEQLAQILGVCQRTVKNRLNSRVMDFIQIKGKRYVRQSELDRYLNLHLIPKKKVCIN